jgi:hypothetical protein
VSPSRRPKSHLRLFDGQVALCAVEYIITRIRVPRSSTAVNTQFEYKGHQVEIMGDPSAPTIAVDGLGLDPLLERQ